MDFAMVRSGDGWRDRRGHVRVSEMRQAVFCRPVVQQSAGVRVFELRTAEMGTARSYCSRRQTMNRPTTRDRLALCR